MSSLRERIERLEGDLVAVPIRISAYHDLPFAIFRYDPTDEFAARREITLLSTRIEQGGRRVHFISLAAMLWDAIERTEGIAALAAEERALGFERAQVTLTTLLSDPDFTQLPVDLASRMRDLDPERDCVFLVRVAALAPAIYRCAKLLEELHGHTMVPIVLFYPGTSDSESDGGPIDLRFMGLPERQGSGQYNYRVKIY